MAFGLDYVMTIPEERIDTIIMLMLTSIAITISVAFTLPRLRQRIVKSLILFPR